MAHCRAESRCSVNGPHHYFYHFRQAYYIQKALVVSRPHQLYLQFTPTHEQARGAPGGISMAPLALPGAGLLPHLLNPRGIASGVW